GAKSALWSFDHETGRFEIVGPMTVADDGTTVCTDPGVGILAPGWHGTQPGSSTDPQPKQPMDPKPKEPPPPPGPEPPQQCDFLEVASKAAGVVASVYKLASVIPVLKGYKCAVSILTGAVQLVGDLRTAGTSGSTSCQVLGFMAAGVKRA